MAENVLLLLAYFNYVAQSMLTIGVQGLSINGFVIKFTTNDIWPVCLALLWSYYLKSQ